MAAAGDADRPTLLAPRERRRRNRDLVVVAILDAARAVIRERGVADLSLREVARRVSMQAPSLYEYFPSKMALYDALFLAGFRLFRARLERDVLGTAPFWEMLRTHFEAYMGFARENPDLYQILFEHPVPGFVPSAESMAEGVPLLDRFTQRIAEAIGSGEIAPGLSAGQARDLAIALMHGITSQHLANDDDGAPGSGRYGGLIGPAIAVLRAAWTPAGTPGAPAAPEHEPARPTSDDEGR